jgi:radical SAM family RiPP maturation amino acid epimerase
MAQTINHPILAFELTAGCSVGCWFCGVSAGKLQGAFPYSAENRRLWRGVLEQTVGLFGAAAQTGFCYWATEPADNPDYPRFIEDFHGTVGVLPSTTSATPVKDPAWTRRVLRLHEELGGLPNRFSILTLRMLDRVHATFTAEELFGVQMVLQNKEAAQPKAHAGRAIERARRSGKPEDDNIVEGATIACVSGFLVNMVERSIRLVSPTPAGARWPLGYRTFGSARFDTAAEFGRAIEALILQHMPPTVAGATPLRFRPDLAYSRTDDGFELTSQGTHYALGGGGATGLLGDLLQEGRSTADDLTAALRLVGLDFLQVADLVQRLFDRGLLEEGAADQSAA